MVQWYTKPCIINDGLWNVFILNDGIPNLRTSREVHEAKWPHTCSRPSAFEEEQNRKNTKDPPRPHHDIHSSPATATISRLRATKHVPRVSPYSPAPIDPGFVEIGFVQLSELPLAKTASVASFSRPVCLQQMAQKNEKKKKHHRHQQSSQ